MEVIGASSLPLRQSHIRADIGWPLAIEREPGQPQIQLKWRPISIPTRSGQKLFLRNLNSETLAVIAFYFFWMFLALGEAKPALHLNGLPRRVQISAATYNRARPSTELRLKALGGGDRTINVRA